MSEMSTWNLLHGDVIEVLRKLPADSVNCCVSSPPYWGLRDYGVSGQIGLEDTPEQWVAKLVEVFREVRRVLRPDGTCWVNLGDSYASDTGGGGGGYFGEINRTFVDSYKPFRRGIPPGCKPKDLIGQPWMFAFAARADGWWLRRDVIWSKPNPMPEQATDRPATSHEYLFLLTKSARYAYDADAVKEDAKQVGRLRGDFDAGGWNGRHDPEKKPSNWGTLPNHSHDPARLSRQKVEQKAAIDSAGAFIRKRVNRQDKGAADAQRAFNRRRTSDPQRDQHPAPLEAKRMPDSNTTPAKRVQVEKRNLRSVWTINTQPFPDAHFATFPERLVEPCILAGCPEGGVVLDPFAGSGTTGVVALKRNRSFVGIELNPEYFAMAERRLAGAAPLFSTRATPLDLAAPAAEEA